MKSHLNRRGRGRRRGRKEEEKKSVDNLNTSGESIHYSKI
jgi:hypothetical protein